MYCTPTRGLNWRKSTDDHRKLSVEEVLKELYQRECRKLGVCPVGAFLRAPARQSLVLKNYSLGPKGAAALAVPLLLDSTVTSVDLEGNGIGAEGLRSLTGALLDSNYITDINLANNKIGHSGVGLVKQLLLTNFYVVHINLSGNHFSDSDAEIFAQVLKENKHLKELILSKNNFGELGGKMLGLEIAANDSLELLDLSWNHIRGKGAVAIAHAVKENVGLKTLRLAFNGLGADGGSAMGDALANNRTLRELDISNNRILDGAVKDLASGIASNDSLELLYMGVNPFTLPSALAIVEAVRRNETGALQLLNLKDVSVTEEFLAVVTEIKESRNFTVVHGLKSKIRLVRPDPPERMQDPDSIIADSESVSSFDEDAGRPSTGKVSFSDETEKHDERKNDPDESSSIKDEGLHQEEQESHDSGESLSDDDTPADNKDDKSNNDVTDDENVSVVSGDTGRERDTVPSRSGSSLPDEADEQLVGRGDPDENRIVTDDDRRNSDISEGLVSPTPDEAVSNADGDSLGSDELEVDGHAASPIEKDGGLGEGGSLEDIREESPDKEGQ